MESNKMKIEFLSKSQNESFARVAVAAFASQLDPTIDEISDIKTAVSEAVTNAIIHGYEDKEDMVIVECEIIKDTFSVTVIDNGVGIEDIELSRQPLYTSKEDMERSGMGFTVMESFMDEIEIESKKGAGTKVKMIKKFKTLGIE